MMYKEIGRRLSCMVSIPTVSGEENEKGFLEYRFTALSEGGYSASPPKNSAIVRLGELMHEIEGEDIFRRELSEGNRAMLRGMAESMTWSVSVPAEERQSERAARSRAATGCWKHV